MPTNRVGFGGKPSKQPKANLGVRQYGQFDQGPGAQYAAPMKGKRTDVLGSPPADTSRRAAEIEAATSDLAEVSNPYIGGNTVRKMSGL